MKKRMIAASVASVIAITAASIYAAAEMPGKRGLDLGPGPVTEQQIRGKLAAAGYSNIQVERRSIFAAAVMKNGRSVELAIDPESGKAIRAGGDDDGDDDD